MISDARPSADDLFAGLSKKFEAADIEWRIGRSGANNNGVWAIALAYVDNRAIMDRLDSVAGPANWKNEFQPATGGFLCGISIRIEGEWVTKWDGAPTTDIESFKGGLSNSMKRAAYQWGIGRYLYNLPETKVQTIPKESNTRHPGAGWNFASTGKGQGAKQFYWKTPTLSAEFLPSGPKTAKPNGKASEPPVAADTLPDDWTEFEINSGEFKGKKVGELAPETIEKFLSAFEEKAPKSAYGIALKEACQKAYSESTTIPY